MFKSRSDKFQFLEAFRQASVGEKVFLILSSWWGTGLLPWAPGTWATVAALPLAACISLAEPAFRAIFLVGFIGLAIWASSRSQAVLMRTDPPEIVLDEVSGFLVAMFLVPMTWLTLALAVIFFRLFDIVKPFPIRYVEKRLRGGAGVVLDDLVAGLFANLCVRGIFLLGKELGF
jgi:phosphatidylglycerophosphatase A